MTNTPLATSVATADAVHSSRLADLALGPLLTIEADQSLWDAWQLLSLSGRRHLVVVDATGRCLGVIADRAILSELPLTEDRLTQRTVAQVMATPAPVTLQDSPRDAARRMLDAAVEAVPVVDDTGRVQGMVTTSDLARWIAAL
jgi:acetoin utilization protein AcuB